VPKAAIDTVTTERRRLRKVFCSAKRSHMVHSRVVAV
jgi:hypothetical protein